MSELLLNNLFKGLKPQGKVLFVWQGVQVPDKFEDTITRLKSVCETVSVEQVDRLAMSGLENTSFDYVFSNLLTPQLKSDFKLLPTYLGLLKPTGLFVEFGSQESADFESELKLTGFSNVRSEKDKDLVALYAEKPKFEVGAVSKLKFASKPAVVDTKKVWQFTEDDINEDDLINTDDLLDELDLKKPAKEEANFDCGTSKEGKKKACKNCSCGLAEEIEQEASAKQKQNTVPAVKSSCGSCYLGDAFRCASCPYLGMPAFKAGEKISISEALLKADI